MKRKFKKPYWVHRWEELPFHDFNREIVPPGASPQFPEGAIGVRVDDDFFAVAALPYTYLDRTIREIVAELWPEVPDPQFNPDTRYRAVLETRRVR